MTDKEPVKKQWTPRELALKQDNLVLTKKDVIEMFDGLVKRWKRYPNSTLNKICIATIIGFKTGIKMTPENVVQLIWTDILKFFNKILMYNQSVKGLDDDEYMKLMFTKIKNEIKEGNFD